MGQDLVNNKLAAAGFQIEQGVVTRCSGTGLKHLLHSARQWLEVHAESVNNLNVFPVPDGDTGTNMVLTMRSAMAYVEQAADVEAGPIAAAAAKGALMGARGNSGVILSQFLQGLAEGLQNQATFAASDFARATALGTGQAYQSIIDPVEGTILTVARAASEAAQQSAAANEDLVAVLTDVLAAAKMAQAGTPALLPVLKEAGVTDAGGQGLVYLLEGGLRFLQHKPVDVDPTSAVAPAQTTLEISEQDYGYDVQFLIQGKALDVAEIRARMNKLGWSTLVVGDEHVVKVHIHSQDPGAPLSYGAHQGVVGDVVIENLDVQARKFARRHSGDKELTIAAIAVAPGPGLVRIFQSLGAGQVIEGGQTMNPSVDDLLAALSQMQAADVLILPNNNNVVLTAQQAQNLSEKNVAVIPTKSVPQGIAALLAYNFQAGLDTNLARMSEAAQQVHTLEVTQAVRDSTVNGFNVKTGEVIGLLDNNLVSTGQDANEVSLDALSQVEPDAHEIITIYFGRESSPEQAEALARRIGTLYPDLAVEVHDGGQPHYQYIISLE